MKETHLFFCPPTDTSKPLPQEVTLTDEESRHALRVLRMKQGDAIWATDGRGSFYDGVIAATQKQACTIEVKSQETAPQLWQGKISLAVVPTKNSDRMEWFVEKATEIGVDHIAFVASANAERRGVRLDRMERHAISAMKQSHKATLPQITDGGDFKKFLEATRHVPHKFIAHCYPMSDIADAATGDKPLLLDVVPQEGESLVLIGPEGDFTVDEVRRAQAVGWRSVSLGESRLRTETAALAAVHMMYLCKRMKP